MSTPEQVPQESNYHNHKQTPREKRRQRPETLREKRRRRRQRAAQAMLLAKTCEQVGLNSASNYDAVQPAQQPNTGSTSGQDKLSSSNTQSKPNIGKANTCVDVSSIPLPGEQQVTGSNHASYNHYELECQMATSMVNQSFTKSLAMAQAQTGWNFNNGAGFYY